MKFIASLLIMAAGLTSAADKTAFDKVALEAYLRHLELWLPSVAVKIDDAKPSADLPGMLDVPVHLSYNGTTIEQHFFVSKDGKKVFQAEVYDINKSPFQGNLDKLDVKGAPSLGPENAPVTVVIFSDFQCPMCKQEADVIHKQLTTAFPDKVRVYFRDLPLDQLHNWARPAALAGRCVYKLNPAAFWDYHDWIYENQNYIGLDNLNSKIEEFATSKNMDTMKLTRCIESKSTATEVNASVAIGTALGLNATPTIFINGRKLEGAVPWASIEAIVKTELDHQAASASAKEDCCTVAIPKIIK